jgi:hypothetical protein
MRVRWIGLALVLALVGAAGYGLGVLARTDATTFASPRPVPAVSPSIPVETAPPFLPDIDYPPLQTDLDYASHRIGNPPYQWTYDVPVGWTSEQIGVLERRWRPPDEPALGGYSMRVKIINERSTTAEMVAQKEAAMLANYDDVDITFRTDDTISFSYREISDRLRFNTFKWFAPAGSSTVQFEASVAGREVDQEGLRDLLDHIAFSARKL